MKAAICTLFVCMYLYNAHVKGAACIVPPPCPVPRCLSKELKHWSTDRENPYMNLVKPGCEFRCEPTP